MIDVLYHTILKASVSFISVIPLTVYLSLSFSLYLSHSLSLSSSLPPSLHLSFFLSLSLSFTLFLSLSLTLSLSLSLSFSLSLSPFLFHNFRCSAFRSQIGQGNGTDGGLIGYNPMYGHDQSTGGTLTSYICNAHLFIYE